MPKKFRSRGWAKFFASLHGLAEALTLRQHALEWEVELHQGWRGWEQNSWVVVLMPRSHRPPFKTAPVADSQRSPDPPLFTTSAREDSQRRWLPRRFACQQMDDPNDLILAMLALVVTAVVLVAGTLYLIARPEPPPPVPPAAIIMSTVR